MTPPLETLLCVELKPPAAVAVGTVLPKAGVVGTALEPPKWSKQAEDVACPQQESIRA